MSVQELDHQGVGVILSCPKLGAFLFQTNDDGHPDKRCRGKIQLWGGRIEDKDHMNPYQALKRELSEEWRDQSVVDEVTRCVSLQSPRFFILESSGGTEHPYEYGLHVFLALVPRDLFMDWFFRLEKCGFNEGRMECLTRTSVEHLIFNAERRKLFLGHLDIVLRYYFGHDKSFRYTQNRVFI